jgi:Xaa-Pro aminopeptidase
MRCENLLVVTEVGKVADSGKKMLGFEPLTMAPFDRRLIEVDLLDEAELNWINDYHAKVFSNLGPLLEDEVRDWLRQATLPLPGTSLPRSG